MRWKASFAQLEFQWCSSRVVPCRRVWVKALSFAPVDVLHRVTRVPCALSDDQSALIVIGLKLRQQAAQPPPRRVALVASVGKSEGSGAEVEQGDAIAEQVDSYHGSPIVAVGLHSAVAETALTSVFAGVQHPPYRIL